MAQKTSWEESKKTKYPKLSEDLQTEVCIIGAGLAGVFSAYLLAKAGKKVVLIEAEEIGKGATYYTTAFLTQIIDTALADQIKIYGAKNAKLILESHCEAINLIEKIVKSEKIECEFMRCAAHIFATEPKQFGKLLDEQAAAKKLALKTQLYEENDLPFKNYGYWHVLNQGKFHPEQFLHALARKAAQKGVKIFENSAAEKISGKKPISVATKNGTITAKQVIIATYKPFNKPKQVKLKQGMYDSYVLEVQVQKNFLQQGLYWDEHNPYNYFRVDALKKSDQLILGGADHRSEFKIPPEKSFKALEEYLKSVMGKRKYKITKRWNGPILEPSDGLALIGAFEPNKYLASAFSGNGMTYSAISAMIFRDLILGKKNPWTKLYDPKRRLKTKRLIKKGEDYLGEFFGAAVKNVYKPKVTAN